MSPTFSIGERVIVRAYRNKIGIIVGQPKEQRGRLFYSVSFDPAQEASYYTESSLEKYLPPRSVEQLLKRNEFSDVEDFLQTIIYKKLEKPLSDNIYTFYASRTEFQVHQFKPVLKFLSSNKQRLLLADEVGLGKTIEAGIIITEMSARLGELSRVLIVCPSMLTDKWEEEMQKRFGLRFTVMKKLDFSKFLQRYKNYGEAERIKTIVSLQTLRSKEMIDEIRSIEPHFDIVVMDEAHYLRNPETYSSELGEVLSSLADAMLFLSATPLQIGTPDLFNLLRLLIPEEFSDFALFQRVIEPNEYINIAQRKLYDPISALESLRQVEKTSQRDRFIKNSFYNEAVELLSNNRKLTHEQAIHMQKLLIELNCLSYVFTRTKKRDVEVQFPVREARVIRVEFTPPEMKFYNAVTKFVSENFTANYGSRQGISFAVIMPQRQIASCIQAMRVKYKKEVEDGVIKAPSKDNGDMPDSSLDSGSNWKLKNREISSIKRLLEIANKIGNIDTKFDMFLETLRELEREDSKAKIMVFAYFKSTLDYLKKKLEATEYNGKVALIHGDIIKKTRLKIIDKFRQSNKIKILLSSEVGGEGLDFEFCNVIFNYDLPWNPMRVEQRIGRLDRYGQQHEKILIYNFSMIGTIDDEILNRLYRRINIFEKYIGDLEAILGDEITRLNREMFNTNLTEQQRIEKINRAAENILRRKEELERFEQECQKFIGQDEYFNQEITRIKENKRFITPEEVKFFIEFFLKKNYRNTTLRPPKSGRENVFVLNSDDSFKIFVRQYSTQSENTIELEEKLSYDGGFQLTFNAQEACKDRSLEFVTIHHPIIKAIKRYYDKNIQNLHTTAQFRLTGDSKYQGKYIFFLYLLEKNALKKDFVLIPILVNLENDKEHIYDKICDWFLSEVVKAKPIDDLNIIIYNEERVESASKKAGEYLGIIREDEEKKLKRNNDTLVNNQIESVKQAAIIKINKAKEIIRKLIEENGKTEEDPIVKLHRGRIRNITSDTEQKVREFEQRRSVSVSFILVAGGVVEIK
ncbi:MAG: DEAD/DEAH box helicase family protein [candidate division Zixibacteria bacterium]|nr:DEAD/DEAH box helicase family protein [Candidatus Tariuqbacter arcticus]